MYQQTTCYRVFLELIVSQLVKEVLVFMELEKPLQCSHKLDNGPCPEPL